MQVWNAIRAIGFIQPRQTPTQTNKAEVVGMKKKFNANKCLDCNNHVPAYLNFYCEDHWKKYLNEKLVTEDAKKIISGKN